MNRKIKFRSWDIKSKRFIKAQDLSYSGNHPVSPTRRGFRLKSRFVIQQFTGLMDTNEVEIYEGDVVQRRFDYNDDPQGMSDVQWSDLTWEVVYDEYEHRFGLKQKNPRYQQSFSEHLPHGKFSNDIKVIGNIFVNKVSKIILNKIK
jgi:uncharacterized phage protein (TIGR01671 family)